MKTTQISLAIAAVATTVTLMSGLAALVQRAHADAYASAATTSYVVSSDKTAIVVTRSV